MAMTKQTIANNTGAAGKPAARKAGAYPAPRRSASVPSARAPKKIHSVYTTRDTNAPYVPVSTSTDDQIACATIAMYGVRYLGCTAPIQRKSDPSSAIA